MYDILEEIQSKLSDKYPLLKEKYDILDCPDCGKKCYPDARRSNGTIVYNRHNCKPPYETTATSESFEIDIEGDLVE